MARILWGIWDTEQNIWCVEAHRVGSYEDDEYVESVAQSNLVFKDKSEALRVTDSLNARCYHESTFEVRNYND